MNTTDNTPDREEPATLGEQIAELLSELTSVQSDLLKLLGRKRELVTAQDSTSLRELHHEEQGLVDRLKRCCVERERLLAEADVQGVPAKNLTSLARRLPGGAPKGLEQNLTDVRRQSRLLQHHSLANWVLVQRSLLHLSQMMEIIATGGRMQPTYGKDAPGNSGGALVDQAV